MKNRPYSKSPQLAADLQKMASFRNESWAEKACFFNLART
jgi:hypothetical protein